jgi:N-acetylmuramoyl-L-alanine amidase
MLGILGAFFTTEANAMNAILNIRHWVAPDYTRIVIDASKEPAYTIEKTNDSIRIDFKNTVSSKNIPQKTVLDKPGVQAISVTSVSGDSVRVEISLAQHTDINVFNLPKLEEKTDRVVVDIELPVLEKEEPDPPAQVEEQRKNRIVVIDPGHGGEDPGAVGPRGTREKDVVLTISRILRDRINKRDGYRAYLTRDGDYYLSFSSRLKKARDYGADLFLSIHADAAPSRLAHGASVYCLSLGGASTEAARLLAVKENLADMIGGSPNGESKDASGPIVLNMYQTNTINTSKIYGQSILESISSVIPLKFATVQNAPFRVLKLPEIPSLLVETAYISNKNEERKLRSGQYQRRIADAIANAVVEILPVEPLRKPTPVVGVAKKQTISHDAATDQSETKTKQEALASAAPAGTEKISFYRVKRGDTLDGIAKKHSTSLSELLKLNNMKLHDSLYTGRRIRIALPDEQAPATQRAPQAVAAITEVSRISGVGASKAEGGVYVYRVRKGDTLAKIAQKHGTTLNALLKLNRMKPNTRLLAGRGIKISEKSEEPATAVSKSAAVQKKEGKFTYYSVKRGETLEIIARRNGITIGRIRQLNRIKPSDVLLADQKLKLPAPSSL